MPTVLITAFEPYDRWPTNAAWLTLMAFLHDKPASPKIVTRLYPVDFACARRMLAEDMRANYDFAIHLGQAPGSGRLRLESMSVNVGQMNGVGASHILEPDGPTAYYTGLPLHAWVEQLRAAGIPSEVSHHAGTFLCNAISYHSQHFAHTLGLKTQSFFLHVPLDVTQVLAEPRDTPCLPVEYGARALRLILADLAVR